MFEKMRAELVRRLAALTDRYEANGRRAQEALQFTERATKLGLGGDEHLTRALSEIASKSYQQAGLCGEAITNLTLDRAFPPMFSRNVVKAEAFAAECERVLDDFEDGQVAGKRAFEQRFGKQEAE
jgi:hypothetical protein